MSETVTPAPQTVVSAPLPSIKTDRMTSLWCLSLKSHLQSYYHSSWPLYSNTEQSTPQLLQYFTFGCILHAHVCLHGDCHLVRMANGIVLLWLRHDRYRFSFPIFVKSITLIFCGKCNSCEYAFSKTSARLASAEDCMQQVVIFNIVLTLWWWLIHQRQVFGKAEGQLFALLVAWCAN